jgi:SAM-dependent methyltransferase
VGIDNAVMRAVCPVCRGPLDFGAERIACGRCAAVFEYRDGFPDLVVGGRFDDDLGEEQTRYEEDSNDWLSRRYLIPTLRRLLSGIPRPRVLSLGCGTGVDVDRLSEEGFDIVGIDNGNRSGSWPRREQRDRLCLANGKHLPFDSGSFDAVYCGCVFPHVGVEGDSNRVRPDYLAERQAIAREMSRVLKPGGRVMVSSPNRLFPIDIFHGRSPGQPYPRLNPPWSPFLLSPGDYRRLFAVAGCGRARLLPVKGYWGFIRQKQRLTGRILAFPIETVFTAVSAEPLRALRGSPVSPWIVMTLEKTHVA